MLLGGQAKYIYIYTCYVPSGARDAEQIISKRFITSLRLPQIVRHFRFLPCSMMIKYARFRTIRTECVIAHRSAALQWRAAELKLNDL